MGHRYREFLFISSGCDVLRSPRLALSSREKTAILYPTPKQHSLGLPLGPQKPDQVLCCGPGVDVLRADRRCSSPEMSGEADEDAISDASFQSADEEEDEDDLNDFSENAGGASSSKGQGGDAQPPGLDDDDDDGGKRWNLKRDGDKAQLEPIFNRLAEDREHVKISKMFSYVLRHAAHKLDVRIRKDGFVRLKDIMELKNFRPYNLEELMACVYFDEKERYTMVREFDGELLIRANQGHTMKVVEDDLLLEPITDPSTVQDCVHGTYLVHWPFIKKQGLSKVARNHIHLAPGLPEDGKIRGMRSTAELFLYIDVPAAMLDGMIFYRSKNEVILTQGLDGWLPVKYFIKAVKINYSTCDIEELDFDRNVNMPNWAAELAPSGPGEAGSYMVKNLEALIANCRKRMAEINELKAQVENGQHLTEEEQSKVDQYAAVYVELQSLEQRFRQHKGYRRESTQAWTSRRFAAMVAPPKAEAAATTEVQAEQRHPVVDRPDEHSWGDRAAGPEQEVQATTAEEPVRRGPSVAVIGTAIRVLVSATEDDLMDSLETVRLKARARLASLFAQSVAEGHSAYDTAPASGADAFYDQEALVSALFDEKPVDDAIQVLSDSEVEGTHADPVRADPPPGQSQHTFGALVAVVTAIGAADKLEDLRKAGVNSAAKLAAASRSQLREILGDVLLDKLLQPAGQGSAAARPKTRSDLPVVHPYARGSLQRIPLDGGKNSFENLDEAFLEDRYAASSKAPIESRWKTWQRLCASRSL
eukprot:s6347_g1.t1